MVPNAGFQLSVVFLALRLLERPWAVDCHSKADDSWMANCPWVASKGAHFLKVIATCQAWPSERAITELPDNDGALLTVQRNTFFPIPLGSSDWSNLNEHETGAPSFCCNFTIIPNGKQWCEVHSYVNGITFLNYNCGSQEVELVSSMALTVNDTGIWKTQTQIPKSLLEELKKQLLDTEAPTHGARDLYSLQGRIVCQQESNGSTGPFIEIGSNGQRFFRFYLKNEEHKMDHRAGKLVGKKWKHDETLTMLLKSTLAEGCTEWNRTYFKYFKDQLQTKAPPTMVPATTTCKSAATKLISWKLPVCLSCLITIGILYS